MDETEGHTPVSSSESLPTKKEIDEKQIKVKEEEKNEEEKQVDNKDIEIKEGNEESKENDENDENNDVDMKENALENNGNEDKKEKEAKKEEQKIQLNNTIRADIRLLNDYLICPICKGYFRDAYTIPECLHTCKYQLFFVFT